jgi:hypothetical protein
MGAVSMKNEHIEGDQPAEPQRRREPEYDISIQHAIERIRTRSKHDAEQAVASECFGEMWYSKTEGLCPMDGTNGNENCPLRNDCEAAYIEAQARIAAKLEQLNAPAPVAQLPPPTPAAPTKEAKAPTKKPRQRKRIDPNSTRGKWKDTDKYKRLGYCPQNRPIDKALAQLVEVLGNPATLPKVWSPRGFDEKYGGLGRIVLSRASSYTSIIVDGLTVMRCWTNANTCMLVDIVTELVKPFGTIDGITKVIPIPEGSAKKSLPCTHRFVLYFSASMHTETIGAIGALVRMVYGK